MTKTRGWPVRAMYMLIAAALVISLIITAAPAQKVSAEVDVYAEWDRVTTPTTDGWVLAPNSTIIDYALASAGEVAYAVVDAYDEDYGDYDYRLLKSDDYAATWEDITDALEDVDESYNITELVQVATDWEDPDFVAVALMEEGELRVYFSIDGGDTFEDAGEVDTALTAGYVSDLAVSYEDDGEREIAIGGTDSTWKTALLFRSTVTGDSAAAWEDATDISEYPGWDNMWPTDTDLSDDLYSWLVTDIIFSPNWDADKTILVTTVNPTLTGLGPDDVYLQSGSWGTSPGWNEKSTLGIEAVAIREGEVLPTWLVSMDARGIAGITLPEDYNGKDSDDRILWVWVNYYEWSTWNPMCEIMRVDDDSAGPVGPMGQVEDGEVWLTNVSYQGTIAEGEAIAGLLGSGTEFIAPCCEGVQVYRNDGIANMDICCIRWEKACKPPTGRVAMAVSYVGGDKAYAVALQGGMDYDEGAWSVTFDDGDTWNQLSLIDTNIDYFSDVAVSPDCNKTFLVSVNIHKVCIEYGEDGGATCDSVWLHAEDLPEAEEYSGKWIRTWCGELEGKREWGLLRLAPEETTGDTVFLVDYMTGNVYWNDLEGLACWDPIASTAVDDIVDLAAQDADTLYALGAYGGHVAMFDDDEWQEEVASEVDTGYTIAVWGDHILVGGEDGDVSYSDDGGETFELLENVASSGYVTVAFDSYFDQNDTIYAALEAGGSDSGVYRWVLGESEEWKDLRAEPLESQIGISDGDSYDETVELEFTGLVVDTADGNPMTSAETGGVIYASYYGSWNATNFTGVARRLYPTEEVICGECGEWDYLTEGLTVDVEGFEAWPDALKICGCLTPDSNSKLFAIDAWWDYDMVYNESGSVWTFEDCYAKKAPEITSPEDGFVVPADPCSCFNVPFNIAWDRLCDACSYDIQFAMDEDFEDLVLPLCELHLVPGAGDAPSFHIPGGALTCEFTYYYRVRASDAETGQIIRSWFSAPQSVTVAPSTAAGEIDLVSPEPGATDVAIEDVGFSWDMMAEADAFDWWIDDNSDFSSPVESKTGLTDTAYGCTETLGYDTTYYWQVIAYNEGAAISSSAVGTFRTMVEPEEPVTPPPVEIPIWVWVIIGIGTALVIVVIVLIFRTRRV